MGKWRNLGDVMIDFLIFAEIFYFTVVILIYLGLVLSDKYYSKNKRRIGNDARMKFFVKEGEFKPSKAGVEEMAEMLHNWYLEATKSLNPKSFNKKAQKKYKDLSEEQKEIDRYIARKVWKLLEYSTDRAFSRANDILEQELETEMDFLQGEIDALIDEVKKIKVMQE